MSAVNAIGAADTMCLGRVTHETARDTVLKIVGGFDQQDKSHMPHLPKDVRDRMGVQ